MNLATKLAGRSKCSRLKVGCVVVSEDNQQVLALGYNGGPKGLYNECLSLEPGKCGHLHAEINALIKLNSRDPARKIMYVTAMPCHSCAVAIINAGLSEVVFGTTYRDDSGVALLEQAGISVLQFLS